jgi:integrase
MAVGFWRKKGRKSKIWYTRVRGPEGRLVERSTGCTDIKQARMAKRRLEREARLEYDRGLVAALSYPLDQACEDLIEESERNGKAAGTVHMLRTKCRALKRIFGEHTDINDIDIKIVKEYVSKRLAEKVGKTDRTISRHTISKELMTLYSMLCLAKRNGHFDGDVDAIKLRGFKSGYVPKRRRLSKGEDASIAAELLPHRRLHFMFILGTGASLGEARRCKPSHVDFENKVLNLPGTKRESRDRFIPFGLFPELETLLRHIVARMCPGQETLFRPWTSMRGDLRRVCDRLGIDPVSANDLRRTFGSRLKNSGVDSAVIARLMGHTSTRMVDRVYGRLDDITLAKAMAKLGEGVSRSVSSEMYTGGLPGTPGQVSEGVGPVGETNERRSNVRLFQKKRKPSPTCADEGLVPRDGIEPPTRGFSVPCSTD